MRGRVLSAGFAVVVACAITITACGGEAEQETAGAGEERTEEPAASPTDSAASSWNDYLALARGKICTYQGGDGAGGQLTSTQGAISVTPNSAGTEYLVEAVTAAGVGDPADSPDAITQRSPYLVHPDGSLSVAQKPAAIPPYVYETDQQVRWPDPSALAAGSTTKTTTTITMTATQPAAQAEIDQMVTSGKGLQMRTSYLVEPAEPVTSITTPSGTYTDLVGVTVSITDASFVNAVPAAARELAAVLDNLRNLVTTQYFARDTGLVEIQVNDFSQQLQGCTG